MKLSIIGLKTEPSGHKYDDKNGMIPLEICHTQDRGERSMYYRVDQDYRSNIRTTEVNFFEDKRWFLIKKEDDAYDITIRMWSFSKKDLEDCLDDSLIIVNENELFKRLTELV